MPVFLKWLLDYAVNKVGPIILAYLKSLKINKEVNEETNELKILQLEANEFIKNNPGQPLPLQLEDRLRAAAIKRANGL